MQKKNNVESVCDMYRHRTKKHKHFSFIIVIAFHSLSPLSTKKRWKKLIYRLFPVFRNISFFYCFWLLLFRITTTTKNKTSIYFFFVSVWISMMMWYLSTQCLRLFQIYFDECQETWFQFLNNFLLLYRHKGTFYKFV